jgi:hypothetical protein
MSRLEATISEPRLEQVRWLEKQLGLSKSQIVDEALSLLTKLVMEAQQGRRPCFIDHQDRLREFTSPILSQLEWETHRERIELPEGDFDRVQQVLDNPPEPTPALRSLSKRKRG